MKLNNQEEKIKFLTELKSHIDRIWNTTFTESEKVDKKGSRNKLLTDSEMLEGSSLPKSLTADVWLHNLKTAKLVSLCQLYNNVAEKPVLNTSIDLKVIYDSTKDQVDSILKKRDEMRRMGLTDMNVVLQTHRSPKMRGDSLFAKFLRWILPKPKSAAFIDKARSEIQDLKSDNVRKAKPTEPAHTEPSEAIPKITLTKKALYKFMAPDRKGNRLPTEARRKIGHDGSIIEDLTNGQFDRFLKENSNRIVYTYSETDPRTQMEVTVEQIITDEINDMIVHKGIIFYKSSATSGSETGETNRLNTWMPSLGLDDKSSAGLGSIGPVFKITKLDRLYDRKFSNVDERIKAYESYLGEDLMYRLNNFDIMLLSAEIGGGFWDTEKGSQLVHKLKEDGFEISVGIVTVSPESRQTHDIPLEVTEEDNDHIKQLTEQSNQFFLEQGGYLHSGLSTGTTEARPDVYQAIYDRARDATSEYHDAIRTHTRP